MGNRVARLAMGICEKGKRGRVYTNDKKLVFSPTTKRLETGGTMRVDFLMCGIGSDARGFR